MKRKWLLVLISMMGIMAALMGVPGDAKRAKETTGKPVKARLQGLKPQVGRAVRTGESIALRDMPVRKVVAGSLLVNDGKVVNKMNTAVERVQPPGAPRESVDGALRGAADSPSGGGVSVTPAPIGSFEALQDTDNGTVGLGAVNPPDTNADVGYTQIVETVNSIFRVYNKAGAPLTPVLKQSDLFNSIGGQCSFSDPGDPIVLHDRIADRWQISQFNFSSTTTPPYHQCIAISKTSDAAGEYYVYDFVLPGNEFPDYPKLGVWPDAYYMTSRQFTNGGGFNGVGAFAFNRLKMLAGDPTAELIYFSIPNDGNYPSNASSGMILSDHDGLLPPPAGAPNVFAIHDSNEFGGVDSLVLFDFHADFITPASSTFTERTESPLVVPAFDDRSPGGRADIEEPSPGENLDSIGDRLMFRLAYRNRSGVESLVATHTVNASGVNPTSAATYQAASRYYELRKSTPAAPYAVHDAGTYSPDAGNGATGTNRWMGSSAIDNQGNLAMGYSASSTTVFPGIRYVGREFNELSASLTNEGVLFAGLGTQAAGGGNRWGDYTSMSVDPVDDCTFWYANEYEPAGNTGFNWHTRIGNFKFPACTAPAQGTLSGTITACDSGAPIGEAKIEVTGGPSTAFSAATADNGTYAIQLAPGTYNVTASSGIRNCTQSASSMVVITGGGTTTFSTCLNGTANLILPEGDPTPATVPAVAGNGNGNGQIDKNECNAMNIDVQNAGCAPARNVTAVLSTTTPGVGVNPTPRSYPDTAINATSSNTLSYLVSTTPSFVCGTPIVFTLTTTYTGGSDVLTFTMPTCQVPPAPFAGTVAPTDPATTSGRLGRNGISSSCAGKVCPGPFGAGPRSYDTHTFVNNGGVAACTSIDVASACGTVILASAYLNSFDPTNLCLNYLGDAGASSANQHLEVTVPAGQTVVVVVMATDNATTTCAYTGSTSGLIGNIDGGGGCAPTAAPASISGRITSPDGAPLGGVTLNLDGARTARAITDSNGNYRFNNIDTDNFYTVTPSLVNYHFSPANRSFSLLANMTDAVFTAERNTVVSGNAIDTPEYFVRQHYLDFLGREPDESGFNFWSDQLRSCGMDAACIERRTINVSAAYFLSIEFQETGGLVDGLYRASYSRRPLYAEFMPDTAIVAREVVVGHAGWAQQLEANKQAFINDWVQRASFRAAYDGLSNASYVDTLISHTGVSFSQSDRDALVNGLASGVTRADALRQIVENGNFVAAKRNEAFVMMQYFGYLRRDPDESGYRFWLNKLNQFGGNFEQAEMVKAFIVSGEYRSRFRL